MARFSVLALPFVFGLAACGSTVDQPEDLPTKFYVAGQPFRMTLVMKHCSDSCATYSDGACDVEVENTVINIDATISFDRDQEECLDVCGAPVYVHCDVPSLAPGEYTVTSGEKFSRTITVR